MNKILKTIAISCAVSFPTVTLAQVASNVDIFTKAVDSEHACGLMSSHMHLGTLKGTDAIDYTVGLSAADSVVNKNAEYARLRREAMSQRNQGEFKIEDEDEDENEDETPKVYSHRNEGHFIFGGLGYGNITSEVINNWYSGSPTNGLEWQLGYEWISDKKIGVGALYSGYAAWGKESTGGSSYVKDMLYINYIAPQFVVKFGSQKSKWSFAASLGLGVGIETQDCKTTGGQGIYRASKAGFGNNESMRVEFAPSARFRLYAMASAITCYISQPELRNHSDKKTGGYARLSIAIGVMHNW